MGDYHPAKEEGDEMTNEEIDRILDAIENNEMDVVISYIQDSEIKFQLENSSLEEIPEEILLQGLKNIMEQIEQEGHEHFFERARWGDGITLDFLSFVADAEQVKGYLKDEKMGFDTSTKLGIVGRLGDFDLVVECINNEELGFTYDEKMQLLSQELYFANPVDVIKLVNDKSFVKNFLIRNKERIDYSEIVDIIQSSNDMKFIMECLKDEELEIGDYAKLDIICATKNVDFVKDCLQDKSIMNNHYYLPGEIVEMVGSTGDIDFIRESLEKEEYELELRDKVELIRLSGDTEFAKECFENENLGFDNYWKFRTIVLMENIDFTRECLHDESISFDKGEKRVLISLMKNPEFIIECINDKSLGLESIDIMNLISSYRDTDFINACIENKDIDLSDLQRKQLIVITKDKEFIDEKFRLKKDKNINLPENMTIGMEIECEGGSSDFVKNFFEYQDWKAKGDGSLQNGVEVVSPILHSTLEDTQAIYTITGMLGELGQDVSDRCGGHIHIGADYLTSKQSYMNLMELWCNSEEILYAISNEKGKGTRTGTIKYAPPISGKVHMALENGTVNLENEEEIDDFVASLKSIQHSRYSGINFMNVNDTKNTIEFRLANGTINPEMWIENVNLFGGIVAVAEELAQIQKDGVRSEEDKHKLEMFDKLKEDISEKEKVEVLLELAGVEPETYMERYDANIGLIKENQEMEEVFAGKEPLDFKAAKDKFKGKESLEIEVSAHAQQEAMEEIVEGHERNLQNERDDRDYMH